MLIIQWSKQNQLVPSESLFGKSAEHYSSRSLLQQPHMYTPFRSPTGYGSSFGPEGCRSVGSQQLAGLPHYPILSTFLYISSSVSLSKTIYFVLEPQLILLVNNCVQLIHNCIKESCLFLYILFKFIVLFFRYFIRESGDLISIYFIDNIGFICSFYGSTINIVKSQQYYYPMQVKATARNIKSASVRQRITPTYYHHDIFGRPLDKLTLVRDTPTFHSTVFDGTTTIQTHNPSSNGQNKSIPIPHLTSSVLYCNATKQRKQADLNSGHYFAALDVATGKHDPKQRMYEEINQMGGHTSRIRKCVEQLSNPIFGGYVWQPLAQYNRYQIPNKQQKKQENKQSKQNEEDENKEIEEQKDIQQIHHTDKPAKSSQKAPQIKPHTLQKQNKNTSKPKGKVGAISKLKSTPNLHQKPAKR